MQQACSYDRVQYNSVEMKMWFFRKSVLWVRLQGFLGMKWSERNVAVS